MEAFALSNGQTDLHREIEKLTQIGTRQRRSG
jgi:hypothetical protein